MEGSEIASRRTRWIMRNKSFPKTSLFLTFCLFLQRKIIAMTAIELQSDTMQLLQRFDKTDSSLWQKVLDALVAIYQEEEIARARKRAEQKAKIRQMVGAFEKSDTDDWKCY